MSVRSTHRPLLALALCGLAVSAGPVLAQGITEPSAWAVSQPEQPKSILVQGATIWTSGPEGILENADLLIREGEIAAVGQSLSAPAGALVIDGFGKHVTPGLIDAHSHTAIAGSVNEGTNITTAEVRIADVINPDDINIYRQLAGGLTAVNILHGSANSIGGQNAVAKLRWGASAQDMLIHSAPQGVKFALGENPKQSNWGDNSNLRYPQTRQGVEQSIRERFLAAQAYQARRQAYEAAGGAKSNLVPPRRDLQLDAVVEMLAGERLVHSHSYRADEILMLLGLSEEFGFTIATFQHVLEGYKVADELAAHGAGASTFSDWWAYKFEVIDAIPYNGAIMHDRGVVVSFNSDSDELARHMNLEAAKAVRYGGVSEAEALKFVTLNPAIQLRIDDRTGSLEKGKDADFVIWNGHPLSTLSMCEQTWIDGRKYFDREDELAARQALEDERKALIAKVLASKKSDESAESEGASDDGSEAPEDAEESQEEPPKNQLSQEEVAP